LPVERLLPFFKKETFGKPADAHRREEEESIDCTEADITSEEQGWGFLYWGMLRTILQILSPTIPTT